MPQGVVPSLDMRCQATLFAGRRGLLRGDDHSVGFPKVAVAMSTAVIARYVLPEFPTGRRAPVADDVSDDLPGGTTQGDSYPALVGSLGDE